MTQSSWKSGSGRQEHREINWPNFRQLLSQLGVILAVASVWGAILYGFVNLTGEESAEPMVEQVAATEGPTVSTTTPTAEATPPAPTPTEQITEPEATNTQEPAESTVEPTATDLPPSKTPEPAPAEANGVSFVQEVLPLFESRCVRCHGSGRAEADLLLDSYSALMAGSEDGAVVIPGDAANSVLVQVVVSGEMPRRSPQLLPAEIQTISDWVNAGAPDN